MDTENKTETTTDMKSRLCKEKEEAYDALHDLAEIQEGELYDEDDEMEQIEYMLEKVMKYGTYCDAVHGIKHFVDYVHALNEIKHAS